MKNIEVYNTLNIDKDSSSIVATFTQEDDAVMEFKLFKDGQEIVLKDQTISLGAERKDGAVIEQEDGFLIKEDNVLNITLKKNIISVVGVVKIQLYLKDKNGEMASNTFNIRVNKKLLGAENVEATNDIKSLNTLVLELKNNTNKLIEDTKSKADKLLSGLQETGDKLSSTVKAKTDKVIEDTKAEVDNIKKDYEGLKKVIIDENIVIKLQKDVTELQNGLKSNQALVYQGSSITANDTLEGRTEGMIIKGKTMYKKKDGSYTDTWEEGVTLESFGEAEQEGDKYKVSILSCGKNLFNCNLLTPSSDQITNFKIDGSIISGNFNGQYNSTKSVEFAVTTKVKVLIKAYLKGCRLIINNCWLENGEFRSIIDTNNWSNNETQELLSSRIVYIDKNSSLRVENPHQSAHSFSVRDLICYKVDGTENESYLPYRQDKKDILIKEPLRSVSDVKDVMYEDNGQVKIDKYVKEYTFTGDEDITISVNKPSSGNYLRVFFQGLNNNLKQMQHGNLLCTTLPPKNLWNIPNEEGISITQGIDMQILKSKLTSHDVQGFKAWLKANPTTIVYQLATPTIEIVENCVDIDLDTYQEKTYFNTLNSLQGTLDFKVPSNIGSVVQNMAKEVNNIWDVINNLLVPSIVKANGNLAMLKLNNNLN